MKTFRALVPLAPLVLAAVMAGAGPAAAEKPERSPAATAGGIKLTVHAHSSGTLMFATDRLSYEVAEGESFSYSSRLCSGPAPFNDLGLDFSPDMAGIDDDADGTAPVRHHVEGTVTEVNGNAGTIEGSITSVLCATEDGTNVATDSAIVSDFVARFTRSGDNDLLVTGRFTIDPGESTGQFAGLEGGGSLRGLFTCLGHQRDATQPTCAEIGEFTDFTAIRGDRDKGPGLIGPGLRGHYRTAA